MRLLPGKKCGGHEYIIDSIAFSPDSERFVVGDLKGGLTVRKRTGEIVVSITVPPAGRYSEPKVVAVA